MAWFVIEDAIRCHKQIHRKLCVRIFEGDVIYKITKVSEKDRERGKQRENERNKRDGGRLVTDTKKILTLIRFDLIQNAHTHTHRRQI